MKRTGLTLTLLAMLVLPAYAGPADLDTVERECGAQLKMPAGACACLRTRAGELKDGQQQFIAAVVKKDKAAQARIRQSLTVQELTEAGLFMTQAPGQCGRRSM